MATIQKLIPMLFCASLATAAVAAPDQGIAPKAYVVADIRVINPEGYKAYLSAISPVVKKYGGAYIARAGRTATVEGSPPAGRVVIIEFPSFAAAEAFETSPEAVAAGAIRHQTATSRIFVVEGSNP
jgi:uncharacterized protein (DUF1330 family)